MAKKGTSVAAQKRDRAQKKVAEIKRRSDANPRSPNGRAKASSVAAAWPTLDPGTVEWGSEEFGALVARMNESMTVKEICVTLGFPNESPYWRKVSLAMRSWKDTHGVARPGRRSEKPVAAPTGRGREQAVKPKKTEHATRRVNLSEMTDEETTAAIEGRWVTYNFASTAGQDEVFVARVVKYDHGVMARGDLGQQRVVTFIDHVSPPGKNEVKAAMEENREPKERADGVTRSLYVSQIVAIGRKG